MRAVRELDEPIVERIVQLDVAADLGAKYVICSIWSQLREYALDSVIRLCELAETVGLGVSVEFLTWSPLPDLAAAVATLWAPELDRR